MGRAIVREPQVFCMDEPLSNLDAKLRVQTRTEIAALQRRLGTTTVYVTHDQVEAMTMGDRVAVLRFGKLQQFASPADLYDRPANVFVAGFIGSPAMNLLTAPITSDGVRVGESSTLTLERDQLAVLHDAGLSEVTAGSGPSNWSFRNPRASRSSSTWSRTSEARPTCTPTPAPAYSWWHDRCPATRHGWPTRYGCVNAPMASCTSSTRRPANGSADNCGDTGIGPASVGSG